jgi:hypothetical protein
VNEFLIFANKIPNGLWTLAAAIFALLGVVITISKQGERFRSQISHERELKDRERVMATKKKMLLGAAEALSAGLNTLAKYGDPRISTKDVTAEFLEKSLAVAKLYVVGSTNTIEKVSVVMNAIAVAQLRLSAMRRELLRLSDISENSDSMRKKSESERDQFFEIIKADHINLAANQARADRLSSAFKFHCEKVQEFIDARIANDEVLSRKQIEIFVTSQELRRDILRILVPAIIAFREELELPSNESELIATMEKSLKSTNDALKEFFNL